MIRAESFVRSVQKQGFELWTGVPCSYLKPFINYVIDAGRATGLKYIPAVNEGDAVAIAAGSTLVGKPTVVMFQNSGFGNAVNPLSSLTYIFKIPVLIITSLRGEPGGPHDEPQHELMGSITTDMLEILKIRWEYFPTEEGDVDAAVVRAVRYMRETGLPFAFVMRKDSVEPYTLKSNVAERGPSAERRVGDSAAIGQRKEPKVKREAILRVLQKFSRPETGDLVVATTGYTGRELYALEDRPNQFYMVGSMGCASSFALGVALSHPDRRVVVVDGDGAVLMRMGALAVVGTQKPANLIHILLDNGTYESTGNQTTVSPWVDLCAVARACGYDRVMELNDPEELAQVLAERNRPGYATALTFIRVPIVSGAPEGLPRPKVTPPEVAQRFARFVGDSSFVLSPDGTVT